jgi:23S rRNA (cytosine1962-C5)-methyltransferase
MSALGLRVVKEGGILVLSSCSGAVSLDEFIDCIRQSAGASGRLLQILDIFQHGADHPINLMAPESAYLKVAFCRVLD